MTKDGRPSRIRDIRLFSGSRNDYLEGGEEAWAFARRLAWWLNGEDVSVGSNHTVYVYLSTQHPEGSVEPGPLARDAESWQMRYVTVGVDPASLTADTDRVAIDAVTRSLASLIPEQATLLAQAAETVDAAGADCRFLLRRKESAKEVLEVTSTIATWPAHSTLFVSLTDTATGSYRESPPLPVKVYDDAVYLAGRIRRTRERISLDPRGSYPAQIIASQIGKVGWEDRQFEEAERPLVSGLLNLR